ncbi:MAG: NYN domain-containing protein [Rhodocyclaceae bacterium]|nr:NYN domain-containing protein [Rhodocyclaceae bacterium]
MAATNDTASMALFCDFENIALGVRDARYDKFDIRPILERLLAKGSIVVKKAYCDWDRYKAFKAGMHEANFELIEIPHVRQSGKNSADIRLVVDALDLCYTKSHVDTFVIISGDSDFSPLVSKLRENAKRVIGVGVKQSCSDLLIANCDEFIYYDDLVRDHTAQRRDSRESAPRRTPEEENSRREKLEARKTKAIELAASTFSDMIADRGDSERIWASVLKEVIKRRNPGFNETYYGFRSFGNLLEEAANRGLIGFGRDEKSGAYVTRVQLRPTTVESAVAEIEPLVVLPAVDAVSVPNNEVPTVQPGGSVRRRGGRRSRRDAEPSPMVAELAPESVSENQGAPAPAEIVSLVEAKVQEKNAAEAKPRRGRRPKVKPALDAPLPDAVVIVADALPAPVKRRKARVTKAEAK